MVITVLEHPYRQKGPTHAQPDAATETGLCRPVHHLADPHLLAPASALALVTVQTLGLGPCQAAPAEGATRTSDLRPFQKTKSTAGLIVARAAVAGVPAPLGAQVPADSLTSVPDERVLRSNAPVPLSAATRLPQRITRCPTRKVPPHRLVNDFELRVEVSFHVSLLDGYAAPVVENLALEKAIFEMDESKSLDNDSMARSATTWGSITKPQSCET